MTTILLTHTPDMLKNYYGARALAELRKLGDVRLNETDKVLDAAAFIKAARRPFKRTLPALTPVSRIFINRADGATPCF